MDWRKEAIEDLSKYPDKQQALINIPERIKAIEGKMYGIKGATISPVPVRGGLSKQEDKLLDGITEIEYLKRAYSSTKREVKLIDSVLSSLSDTEKLILERFFIYPEKGSLSRLADELGYEQRSLYRMRDEALYRFTIKMFGIIEL